LSPGGPPGFKFAIESDTITADGIEVTSYSGAGAEVPDSSVPKTVVARRTSSWAGPESMLLKHVQEAAADPPAPPCPRLII